MEVRIDQENYGFQNTLVITLWKLIYYNTKNQLKHLKNQLEVESHNF